MRDEFPIFRKDPNWIYLDTAATAQKPDCVLDALYRFYAEEYATVHRALYSPSISASKRYEETRIASARFLNAHSEKEIIFTKGTTDSLNLVAQSFVRPFVKEGDEIIISEMEHHSNFLPWQMIREQTGASLKILSFNGRGELEWEGAISPKTKIVALAHVSNVTGTIHPIEEIAKEAHRKGAIVIVDGAQAAPHFPVDVQKLGADFYAFSGHKCYGPNGIGILYGKAELLAEMQPYQGGGDMVEEVTLSSYRPHPPPLCFEAGTPNIASVIAFKEALEFTQRAYFLGDTLLPLATEKLLEIPNVKLLGQAPKKVPILTFSMESVHSMDLASLLDLKNISIRSGHLCAQPLLRRFGLKSACRISFGAYNTQEEVEKLALALREAACTLHR